MRCSRVQTCYLSVLVCLSAMCLLADRARAVVAPSTWTTDINVQEDPNLVDPFDDWNSSGIPFVVTDPEDNPGLWDINQIRIANDDEFIYLHVTYHNNLSVGTLLGFDLDQDPNTGFDVQDLGLIGSELGYLNDFAFEQEDGVFNNEDPLLGGPIGNGGALIWPFFNINGPEKEYAIPLDAMFTNDMTDPNGPPVQTPAFASDTFDLMVYHDLGLGDITEVITYTLATDPNPCGDGDFDCNGSVDGIDFLEWQQGNSPNNGSSGDLALWETNYNTPPLVGAVGAVPEPTSIMLAVYSLTLLGCRRRTAG